MQTSWPARRVVGLSPNANIELVIGRVNTDGSVGIDFENSDGPQFNVDVKTKRSSELWNLRSWYSRQE